MNFNFEVPEVIQQNIKKIGVILLGGLCFLYGCQGGASEAEKESAVAAEGAQQSTIQENGDAHLLLHDWWLALSQPMEAQEEKQEGATLESADIGDEGIEEQEDSGEESDPIAQEDSASPETSSGTTMERIAEHFLKALEAGSISPSAAQAALTQYALQCSEEQRTNLQKNVQTISTLVQSVEGTPSQVQLKEGASGSSFHLAAAWDEYVRALEEALELR